MKKFNYVIITTLTVLFVAFLGNTYYLLSLYGSIKTQYLSTARDCLLQADFIEISKRLKARYDVADSDFTVNVAIIPDKRLTDDGNIVSETNAVPNDSIKLLSLFEAMQTTMAYNLRNQMPSHDVDMTDFETLTTDFRMLLNQVGINPKTVIVIPGDSVPTFPTGNMWSIDYSLFKNSPVIYRAYFTPPLGGILEQTLGVIISTFVIFVTLCVAFCYLVKTVLRLRTLEEMKDDFTNNMTHELKTPIAASYTAIDTLLNCGSDSNPAKRERYLRLALDQLTRLSGLVECILSMSMERRKTLVLEQTCIQVKPFFDEIVAPYLLNTGKNVTVRVNVQPENLTLRTDPTHFANIINNLLDNAVKYSGESVAIEIDADDKGLRIADNGIGISHKALPHIFKKFYRAAGGNCAEVRGYGIGLYYVKSMIEKMHWSINVKSTLGSGTVFTIAFRHDEK